MLTDASTGDDRVAVSITEAARRLGVGRTTLYERIKDGSLRSFHVGRRHLVRLDDLDRLTSTSRAEGETDAVAEILQRTRTDRGMALVIDDPATIAKVAGILATAEAESGGAA